MRVVSQGPKRTLQQRYPFGSRDALMVSVFGALRGAGTRKPDNALNTVNAAAEPPPVTDSAGAQGQPLLHRPLGQPLSPTNSAG